jgi:hypothetical protein
MTRWNNMKKKHKEKFVMLEDVYETSVEGTLLDQLISVSSAPYCTSGRGRYARGIEVNIQGHGHPTAGEPVIIENRKGVPYVVIWADPNQEDPTHTISLEELHV